MLRAIRERVALMRRMAVLLAVALVMAAMAVVSAMPAFADPVFNRNEVAPVCEDGIAIARDGTRNVNPGAANRSDRAATKLVEHYESCYGA